MLPSGMTISAVPGVTSSCGGGAFIVAEPEGTSISLSNGQVGPGATCSISLYVTADLIEGETVYMNTSGDLTSDVGNSGFASANLTVTPGRPGFSKSFIPSVIAPLGTSRLTFLIDNSTNGTKVNDMSFTDILPFGLVVAPFAMATSTCGTSFSGNTITAIPGSNQISYSGIRFSDPLVPAGGSCTIAVDVVSTGPAIYDNTVVLRSASTLFGAQLSSGIALARLTANPVAFSKIFKDDPVQAGGTVTLEFTIINLDRDNELTNISFTDDLDETLAGLVATSLPVDGFCGAGSSLTGTSVLTLTGGNLAPEASCTFSVTLQVPNMASPGVYSNITSSLTGDRGGAMVTLVPAFDDLTINEAPILSKSFTNDPASPGGTVDLEFTITNSSATNDLTNISFTDNFEVILPTASVIPMAGACGMGSSFTFTPLFNPPSSTTPARLSVSGGSLAPGASCSFTITLDVSEAAPGGIYHNMTSLITGVVDGQNVAGNPATDDLTILSAPRITKEFINDPVLPGNTVDLEFTITFDEFAAGDATNISFTDNLEVVVPGLVPSGALPTDPCGIGSSLSFMGGVLSLSGGTLIPGGSCSFTITLDVPPDAPAGSQVNTTSNIEAMVLGQLVQGNKAQDGLVVNPLVFSKQFIGDPALPGELITLRFIINNKAGILPVTDIVFIDNLNAVLPGLLAEGLPINDVCGTGSMISGTSNLLFTGGNLAVGDSCTFDVPVRIPDGASNGTFNNVTSSLTATIDGSGVILPPANDNLEINTQILSVSKEFTDDPVLPGGTVTLEFTIENLDPVRIIDNITFTDDLNAALSGLTAVGLPLNDVCGTGSQISGTSLISFTGGTLAPGASCTFLVTLQIPALVNSSDFLNLTSDIAGEVDGVPVQGGPASDILKVRNLSLEKEFSGSGIAGGTVDLTFTINNLQENAVTGINFSDDLSAMLAGATVIALPASGAFCGQSAQFAGSGSSTFSFTNGELLAQSTCIFPITIQLPCDATDGTYPNTSSVISASGLTAPGAFDELDLIAALPVTFTKPPDITIYMDMYCEFDSTLAHTGNVTNVIHSCCTTFDTNHVDVVLLIGCSGTGTIERTWSIVDCNGVSSMEQVQIITVVDTIQPIILCPVSPAPIDLPIDFNANPVGSNTPQHPSISPSTYGFASATDNCGNVVVTYQDVVIGPSPENCPILFLVERTWVATDLCGLMKTCLQTFMLSSEGVVPSAITGPATICPSLKNLPYSVVKTTGETYDWSFSNASASITGNGSNEILISFDASFTGGILSVSTTNACGTSRASTLNIVKGSKFLRAYFVSG
ncbi:MAG: hypothetical protein IPL46_32595 [Saprospiraceae bacterium]|nr:hypothetical protein [Saprospiraceae bacterium]